MLVRQAFVARYGRLLTSTIGKSGKSECCESGRMFCLSEYLRTGCRPKFQSDRFIRVTLSGICFQRQEYFFDIGWNFQALHLFWKISICLPKRHFYKNTVHRLEQDNYCIKTWAVSNPDPLKNLAKQVEISCLCRSKIMTLKVGMHCTVVYGKLLVCSFN